MVAQGRVRIRDRLPFHHLSLLGFRRGARLLPTPARGFGERRP
jgi:hypothetical protein